MAKRKAQAPRQLSRKQTSRLQREARMNRILIASVATVAVLVVAVLGYGYISERVIKPGQPVAIVNGAPIRTGDLESRVFFLKMANHLFCGFNSFVDVLISPNIRGSTSR